MRDVLGVTAVIVLAMCLGVAAAYLSVDLTPPGLELIRPPKAAIAEKINRENKQSAIQAQASECKYCIAVAEMAQTFARHAKSARQHADALQEAMMVDRGVSSRAEELRMAQRSAEGAEAAAASLTSWAARCKSEDFCRVAVPTKVATCASEPSGTASAALMLAAAVRKSAGRCASVSCPAVDCAQASGLRNQVGFVAQALEKTGAGLSTVASGVTPGQLAVGASTLKAELERVGDEAVYVTKMLPLLLDNASANSPKANLPQLAAEMVDERAVSASQLAGVMEKAAAVGDSRSDPRYEAAWRLKSFAANLAVLGKGMQIQDGRAIDWASATDAMGAALFDLARLQAMLDRVSAAPRPAAGCDSTGPNALQQLRESIAMIDLCRMRSACSRAAAGAAVPGGGDAASIAAEAQAAAEGLIVNEMSNPQLLAVSSGAAELTPIEFLRSQQGVCVRAAELREASTVAPSATQDVAQGSTEGLRAAVGPIAPQDVVDGAADTALNGDLPAEPESEVVKVAAPAVREAAPQSEDVVPAAVSAPAEPRSSVVSLTASPRGAPQTPGFVAAHDAAAAGGKAP